MSDIQPGSIWIYKPNKVAAIVFTIAFGVSWAVHDRQRKHYGSWRISGLLPWGAMLFTVGFGVRCGAAFGQWDNTSLYIASTIFLFLAPPVFESANVFLLGRLLYYVPHLSPLHPARVVTTFLGLAFIMEVFSIAGVIKLIYSGSSEASREVGRSLIKTSFILQLVSMLAFMGLASNFRRTCLREEIHSKKLHLPMRILFASCTLIACRTLFRTIQYFISPTNNLRGIHNDPTSTLDLHPLHTVEAYFYGLDAAFMLLNSVMLNIFHPARFLPKSDDTYLDSKGTEVDGPGYTFDDKRNLLIRVLDPLDLIGWFTKKDEASKYWLQPNPNPNHDGAMEMGTTHARKQQQQRQV